MYLSLADKKRGNFLVWLTIAVLALVLYLGNTFTFNTSKLVDIICLVFFPFLDVTGILATVAFLVPVNSGISVLYIYGYAIVMLLLKKRTIPMQVLMPTIVIFLYELFMVLFVPSTNINIMSIVIYVCTVFLLLYLMYTGDADYKLCCYSYIFGTMVLLISVFTTAIQNTSLEQILSGNIRIGTYEGLEDLGGKVAVITENANSLAYYALVAIIISFLLLKKTSFVGRIFLTLSTIVGIVIGLFTISRTFLLVLLGALVLIIAFGFKSKQKIAIVVGVGIILYFGVPYLLEVTGIFESFTNRFDDDATASLSGRPALFIEYMEFLWKNPGRLLFGTGAVFYKQVTQCSNSLHCGLQQILVSYGIVGFVPMIYLLIKPMRDYFKTKKISVEKIIPLVCVIVFTQTIQFLNPFNLMLPYAIAVMYIKIPEEENGE